MILIDALFINNGGGMILLDYLVKELEKRDVKAFYLIDSRIEKWSSKIPNNRKKILEGSLVKRHYFYTTNKNKFRKVFCFGNLAPSIKLNVPVYTYFHQPMYLDVPKEFSFKSKVLFKIKTIVFKFLLKNSDFLLVQNAFIGSLCESKFAFENIITCPFYPPLLESVGEVTYKDKDLNFLYVSSGAEHKNHIRLLSAFKIFFDKYKKGRLSITVGDGFSSLISIVKDLQLKGYPIYNLGFIDREDLVNVYKENKFLIFPSLRESFGLGIVEAIESGCEVIGADLPYMNEVCSPALKFDPYNIKSIVAAMEDSINFDGNTKTEQKIFNRIDELILLIN